MSKTDQIKQDINAVCAFKSLHEAYPNILDAIQTLAEIQGDIFVSEILQHEPALTTALLHSNKKCVQDYLRGNKCLMPNNIQAKQLDNCEIVTADNKRVAIVQRVRMTALRHVLVDATGKGYEVILPKQSYVDSEYKTGDSDSIRLIIASDTDSTGVLTVFSEQEQSNDQSADA